MRINEILTEAQLHVDVPNEEWLQGKIRMASQQGPDNFGVPYMTSSCTARINPPVELPVSLLKRIPGARGEQNTVRKDDLEAIMKIMRDTGKLPLRKNGEEYLPFICVAYDGSAWVYEGNHRIMAAAALGWNSLKVDISYFAGGERVKDGLLYPGKIGINENFADGQGPGKPGDSVRHGIPKHATQSELKTASHAKGRKGQLARWQINMRKGHDKT